ncbi:MAG: hypothetical protein AAB573_05240 [Patescibacteria group bacterium]
MQENKEDKILVRAGAVVTRWMEIVNRATEGSDEWKKALRNAYLANQIYERRTYGL